MMPRCDGPETLRRIRRDHRLADLRVFSVSGADPRNLGVPTGAGGLDAWFAKPLDPEKLWDAIRLRETAAAN
jgi:CheY-like chemotaxis protein